MVLISFQYSTSEMFEQQSTDRPWEAIVQQRGLLKRYKPFHNRLPMTICFEKLVRKVFDISYGLIHVGSAVDVDLFSCNIGSFL